MLEHDRIRAARCGCRYDAPTGLRVHACFRHKDRVPIHRGSRPKARYRTKGGRHSDPEKLEWLRSQNCVVREKAKNPTPCEGWMEAHHDRPGGSRATDKRSCPLCHGHHQAGEFSLEKMGRKRFETHHGLNVAVECDRYEMEWQQVKNERAF